MKIKIDITFFFIIPNQFRMTKAIKIFIYFLAWNSEHYYIYENDVRIRSYYYYTIVTIV